MLSCYTDVQSAAPGDSFAIHASSSVTPCSLIISRVGLKRRIVHTNEHLAVGDHATPPQADQFGCAWPEACRIEVGAEWATGYYDIQLASASGEETHHFICVRKAVQAPTARAALILATNTYNAYNWWGGRNAYCDVGAVMAGDLKLAAGMERSLGVLSSLRPFPQGIIAIKNGAPRLMNAGPRAFGARPRAMNGAFWRESAYSTYDGAAGFINKWEQSFAEWAELNGLVLDYLTDYDLDADPAALDGYRVALAVGHSEYWSGPQRETVERFVDNGGNLAVFSGNTCYWKVRWADDGRTMICHKWKGIEAEPDAGRDGSGMWSHANFGKPEAELIGLSFLFGGYHRLGMCVARGSGAYSVYDEGHWALDGADLFYGDELGAEIPLLGYENDGCLFQFDDDRRLKAIPHLGVPANLEIIAVAPCAYGEDLTRGYPPSIPPEDLRYAARVAYGTDEPSAVSKLLRGHAVMASFKRGAGEVFNVGTTEWAHALRAGEPMIERITRNVLTRFGAYP